MKKYNYNSTGKKGSFAAGFLSIFASLKRIREEKSFLVWFVVPFFLNIIILLGAFYFTFSKVYPWLTGLLTGDAWYLVVVQSVAGFFLVVILIIITFFAYSILGNIVTAPFNDFLSQKVEERIFKESFEENLPLWMIVKDLGRALKNGLRLLLFMAGINIILLILNLIPGIGQVIYIVINSIATWYLLGLQFFDYPLERRRFTHSEKMKILRHHFFLVTGTGAGFFLITFIPIIGFLGLNLGTIGATETFSLYIKEKCALEPGGDR